MTDIGNRNVFYLGTDMAYWLSSVQVPLFVSHRRLRKYKRLPEAGVSWALDSGGFTELSTYGRWTTEPDDYVAAVKRYIENVGRLTWAAPQDAMCEPWILEKAKSWLGGTVIAHQEWTVNNYLRLRDSGLPFIPVLQGWELGDYLRHVEMYDNAGVDLWSCDTVGLGSVCRRQATDQIAAIVHRLADTGLRLHGFGVKTTGIAKYGWRLKSADSMAWSFRGRYVKPCPVRNASSCAHCLHFALDWRSSVLARAERTDHYQPTLAFEECPLEAADD